MIFHFHFHCLFEALSNFEGNAIDKTDTRMARDIEVNFQITVILFAYRAQYRYLLSL